MADPFDAAGVFDAGMDRFARVLLFIADDLDLGIEGGEGAQPLGLCDAGRRGAAKPGLAGDLPEGLAGPAQGFNLERLFGRDPRPQPVRPAGLVLKTGRAFPLKAPQPLGNRRGRNACGAGDGARRFARLAPLGNQCSHLRCCFGILMNVRGRVA